MVGEWGFDMRQNHTLFLNIDILGFAADTGMTFRGLSVTERGDGWNVVIRASNRSGERVYAMVTAVDPMEGVDALFEYVSSRGGVNAWRIDKYAQ